MQELELKMEGGAYARGGGVIAGFYGINFICRGCGYVQVNHNFVIIILHTTKNIFSDDHFS